MSPTNIGIDKVTGTLSKWITNMVKMHPGKKLYASLWTLTGIILIVEIVLQILWSNDSTPTQANAIAGVLIVFVIFLFGAIISTVIVSIRLRRAKPKIATSTVMKQGGKK